MKKVLLTSILGLALVASASATIRNVPASYPTIQSALNACLPLDTVLVQPGTYIENIIWPSVNGIRLLSTGGALATTISAGSSGRVVSITSASIDTNTVINGFTISGGYITTGSGYGAGIYITNASVKLEDVNVNGNRVFVPGGHGYGAGVHLSNSSSLFNNVNITGNSIDSATWCYGGGMYISGGFPELTDVTISGNSARAENWCYGVGLYVRNGSTIKLTNVKVLQNISGDNAIWYYGYGIYFDDSNAQLTNVLVANNKAGAGGSFNYGGGIYCDGTSLVTMMNVTIAENSKTGNTSINGTGIYARDAGVSIVNSILYNLNTGIETAVGGTGIINITYSNVRNGVTGTGNINALPGFVSATDFHLLPTSPCVTAGTLSGAPSTDLDGNVRPLPAFTNPDLGCYEVDQSATGLAEVSNSQSKLLAWPNPVNEGEEITIGNISGSELIITDSQGKILLVVQSPEKTETINTTGWAPGFYLAGSRNAVPLKIAVIR